MIPPFLAGAFLLTLAFPVSGADPIQVHGFGGWGYGHTDGNRYLVGDKDGVFHNSYFALNVSGTPSERFSASFQTLWKTSENGMEVEFDYAFAEYAFADFLKIRLGKVKTPFGIYTEIYDVGTLRPFYALPQSVYGTPGMVTKSYFGVGLTGSHYLPSNWGFRYDLYGGQNILEPHLTLTAQGTVAVQQTNFDNVIGIMLIAYTPFPGLSAGFSLYGGEPEHFLGGEPNPNQTVVDWHNVFMGHVEYLTDTWLVRAEHLFFFKMDGKDLVIRTGYLEAAYRFLENWQIAALLNYQDVDFHIDLPEFLNIPTEEQEAALGINYWFNPNFVLKLSYHFVHGNVHAFPSDEEEYFVGVINESLDERTNLVLFGAQFSF